MQDIKKEQDRNKKQTRYGLIPSLMLLLRLRLRLRLSSTKETLHEGGDHVAKVDATCGSTSG